MTATLPTNPGTFEPPREEEYVVPLTGKRRAWHLHRLLEMRDAFARLSTERYCHALPDAPEVFTMMAAVEQEIAALYPDVHAHLFPTWVSNVADCGHEPGQYNPRCGICLAQRPGIHLCAVAD